MNSLNEKYKKIVIPALREKFNYKNVMSVPKIEKVVVAVGTGRIGKEKNLQVKIENDIALISGQKPALRKAKKSIAGFKLREGMPVGLQVTLRGRRMHSFIDRLINIALPRTRDFRGLDNKSFDERGNLNIGIIEQIVFPEVAYESAKDIFSFQVTIVTTAKNKSEGVELLKLIGFPIH